MIQRDKTLQQLQGKRDQFVAFEDSFQDEAAVDGSQIRSDDDFSIPVAAAQVAWFENRRTVDRHYVKDARLEVLNLAMQDQHDVKTLQ
jgi:hypothetical protein